MPNLLRTDPSAEPGEKGWQTPEQGELTAWRQAFTRRIVPAAVVNFQGTEVDKLFQRIVQIRHAAVHRLPTSNSRIRHKMIPNALRVISGVRDAVRYQKLLDIQTAFTGGQDGAPNIELLEEILSINPQNPAGYEQLLIPLKRGAVDRESPAKRARVCKYFVKSHELRDMQRSSTDEQCLLFFSWGTRKMRLVVQPRIRYSLTTRKSMRPRKYMSPDSIAANFNAKWIGKATYPIGRFIRLKTS
jgi:hypothetical protein